MDKMANKVSLHDDGYIEISVIGDQNEASVRAMGEEVIKLLDQLTKESRPLLVLDDIRQLGHTDTHARRAVSELAKTLHFDRLAMVGDGSTLMRVGTNLMLTAIGKGDTIHYFDNYDEAVTWLRERR